MYVCVLANPTQEAVLCVPADRRLPYIRVRTRNGAKLAGQRFVLRIDEWDRKSRWVIGSRAQW